jgi:hypothetical protein
MAITTFPDYASLQFEGHSYEPQQIVQRTQFEDGSVRQHMYASRNLVRRQVRYTLCTAGDFKSFRDWVRDDLCRGARWFMWNDPVKEREGSTGLVRARIVDGQVKFSPFEESLGVWFADFTIEHWDTAL